MAFLIAAWNSKFLSLLIECPEIRNAIDGPTALALAEAFREFEANDALGAAVQDRRRVSWRGRWRRHRVAC